MHSLKLLLIFLLIATPAIARDQGATTFKGDVTLDTGKDFTIGTTQWNTGDYIDGEQIGNDTIDDDSIDFTDVTCVDITATDCGAVTSTGTITAAVGFDCTGAADCDFGSADILDLTFTEADSTFIIDGGITVSTGDKIQIGSTQWNSGDSIDGTKVANADLGEIIVSSGVWSIDDTISVTNWTIDTLTVTTAFTGAGLVGDEDLQSEDFGDFTCAGEDACTLDANSVADNEIDYTNVTCADLTTTDCGAITISTGSSLLIGTTQWDDAGDNIDGTKVGNADLGEITVAAGVWTIDDTLTVAGWTLTGASVTGTLTGNADTATALAADPADCSANQYANAIAASGALTCASIADADVPNNITIDLATAATNVSDADFGEVTVSSGVWTIDDTLTVADWTMTGASITGALTGNASTATALAANGANCNSGEYPLGVDASGAVESCTDATTEINTEIASVLDGTDVFTDINATDIIDHSNILDSDQADTKCIRFEDPTADDDFASIWANKTANDFLITEIWCESDQTIDFDLQIDDGSPADVNGTDIQCAAGEAEDTSLSGDTTLAAGEELDLVVTSVANTPTWVTICWTGNWVD